MRRRFSTTAPLLLIAALTLPSYTFGQQPQQQQQTAPPPTTNAPTDAAKPTASQVADKSAQQQQTAPAKDPNDPVARIKDEGLNRSQVMKTLGYLSDVIGPRLTGSPNLKRANEWTRDQLTQWGLQNGHLEAWGPFGRGWVLKDFSASVNSPQTIPLIAYPLAWSPSLKNALTSDVVYVDAKDENDLARFKGTLRGKIILTGTMPVVKAHFDALGVRLTDKELLELADAPVPGGGPSRRFSPTDPRAQTFIKNAIFSAKKLQFFTDEGAALLVNPSRDGDGGTIFVQGAGVPQTLDTSSPIATLRSVFMGRVHPYDKNAPAIVPQIVVASEQYNRLARMIAAGERVQMNVRLDTQFVDNDLMAYNTVAEIPGTDKSDELVMVGAHMDSWHSGTGATDNGAGCAVAMEAVRILQTLNLKPRRTVRIALWSGEEQGLLGSQAFVAKHFGKTDESPDSNFMRMVSGGGAVPPKVTTGPEYDKLSAYYNLDNGTGKIRGVYLQGNESVRAIFREWLAPFREMGAQTLSISNTGGTDHLSFDAIGLPGFQFIQDEIEYETRTHHSNQDVFDRAQEDDLKQAAVIMAAFIYNTAMRDEKLPRKTTATAAR